MMTRPTRQHIDRTRRSITANRERVERTRQAIAESRALAREAAEEVARLPGLPAPSKGHPPADDEGHR